MDDLKITVLMPCYNAEKFISDAIESVLAQSFRDFELLIVNDGSTDNTAKVIQKFRDDRIVYIEQKRLGVGMALNNGLRHARAEYIARFDADDICRPDRLARQYAHMLDHPDCIIVGSAADYIDDRGNYVFTHTPPALDDEGIRSLHYSVCPFIHSSVLYKKRIISETGYNPDAHSFEDHLLWLQLKSKGKMHNLPDQLIQVRLNPESLTMDEKKRPKLFQQIKNRALKNQKINNEDGALLLEIISRQSNPTIKKGAYYSLLAKKFLWNNYDPEKSRLNVKKAIRINAFDIRDYLLFVLSYLPKNLISRIYSLFIATR